MKKGSLQVAVAGRRASPEGERKHKAMGKDQLQRQSQSNTIMQYATSCQPLHCIPKLSRLDSPEGSAPDVEEPSRADILEAIRGSQEALEVTDRGGLH